MWGAIFLYHCSGTNDNDIVLFTVYTYSEPFYYNKKTLIFSTIIFGIAIRYVYTMKEPLIYSNAVQSKIKSSINVKQFLAEIIFTAFPYNTKRCNV